MKLILAFLLCVGIYGCAVKVEYMVTEQSPTGVVTTHHISYERPVFVGQEIGEFSMSRDEAGHPKISFSGQKSDATLVVSQAVELARIAAGTP